MKSLLILLFFWGMAFTPTTEINTATEVTTIEAEKKWVEFTLRNNSLKSIPIIIPGVMKPNLSPLSNSGVGLKIGQKIFFRYKGKRRLLFKVTRDLEGETLNVSKLIKEEKQILDKCRQEKKNNRKYKNK